MTSLYSVYPFYEGAGGVAGEGGTVWRKKEAL